MLTATNIVDYYLYIGYDKRGISFTNMMKSYLQKPK